jgi:hypothetical protein
MREVRVESAIACGVEAFWKLFVDRAFNEALFRDGLAFEQFEILEMTDTRRVVRCTPKVSVPGPLRKLLGDRFSYEERGEMDPSGASWRWEVIPSAMPSKISNSGSVRTEDLGDGRCKRIDEMRIEARVFGVGGLIESSTESQVTDAWKQTAIFTNEWIRKHG